MARLGRDPEGRRRARVSVVDDEGGWDIALAGRVVTHDRAGIDRQAIMRRRLRSHLMRTQRGAVAADEIFVKRIFEWALTVGDLIEPEPAVVEIDLLLADNSVAVLRMNVFVAGELADKLAAIGG